MAVSQLKKWHKRPVLPSAVMNVSTLKPSVNANRLCIVTLTQHPSNNPVITWLYTSDFANPPASTTSLLWGSEPWGSHRVSRRLSVYYDRISYNPPWMYCAALTPSLNKIVCLEKRGFWELCSHFTFPQHLKVHIGNFYWATASCWCPGNFLLLVHQSVEKEWQHSDVFSSSHIGQWLRDTPVPTCLDAAASRGRYGRSLLFSEWKAP